MELIDLLIEIIHFSLTLKGRTWKGISPEGLVAFMVPVNTNIYPRHTNTYEEIHKYIDTYTNTSTTYKYIDEYLNMLLLIKYIRPPTL